MFYRYKMPAIVAKVIFIKYLNSDNIITNVFCCCCVLHFQHYSVGSNYNAAITIQLPMVYNSTKPTTVFYGI